MCGINKQLDFTGVSICDNYSFGHNRLAIIVDQIKPFKIDSI